MTVIQFFIFVVRLYRSGKNSKTKNRKIRYIRVQKETQQEETMAADNTEKDKKDNSFMMKLATLIVDKRKGFYLIFIVLCIFCVLSMNKMCIRDR